MLKLPGVGGALDAFFDAGRAGAGEGVAAAEKGLSKAGWPHIGVVAADWMPTAGRVAGYATHGTGQPQPSTCLLLGLLLGPLLFLASWNRFAALAIVF